MRLRPEPLQPRDFVLVAFWLAMKIVAGLVIGALSSRPSGLRLGSSLWRRADSAHEKAPPVPPLIRNGHAAMRLKAANDNIPQAERRIRMLRRVWAGFTTLVASVRRMAAGGFGSAPSEATELRVRSPYPSLRLSR